MAKTKQKQASKQPTRDDIKAAVCESIIEAIKNGDRVWDKPWIGGGMLPMRVGTKTGGEWGTDGGARPYRGINVWHLNHKSSQYGYKSAWWGTFNHWKDEARKHAIKQGEWEWAETKDGKRYKKPTKNYGIKKGESAKEKMQCVVYWSMLRIKDKKDPKNADKDKTIPILKWFWVFNRDQTHLPPSLSPRVSRLSRASDASRQRVSWTVSSKTMRLISERVVARHISAHHRIMSRFPCVRTSRALRAVYRPSCTN